jgi:diadenylate cyclase
MGAAEFAQFFQLGFRDVVDLLLVALFLYYFFQLFRGTRAVQMVLGFALLVLIWAGAEWAGLRGVQWLFSNLLTVGVVSLVILFQPELRGALTRLGQIASQKGFGRLMLRSDPTEELVESIVLAVRDLSRDRWGALIILERHVGLRSVVDTGEPMDSSISPVLLRSIFFPKNPLHDGALVIHQHRIIAAACTLPMAPAETEERRMGMRHRAAAGLAQESDAVAVVVSEETGRISLAIRNRFERGITPGQLRRELLSILSDHPEK